MMYTKTQKYVKSSFDDQGLTRIDDWFQGLLDELDGSGNTLFWIWNKKFFEKNELRTSKKRRQNVSVFIFVWAGF